MIKLLQKRTRCLLIHPKFSPYSFWNFVEVSKIVDAKYQAATGEVQGTFRTEAYLTRPESVYDGQIDSLQGKMKKDSLNTFAKRSSGIIMPEYRLPTETEWEYAAQANQGSREYNNYRGRKKYP